MLTERLNASLRCPTVLSSLSVGCCVTRLHSGIVFHARANLYMQSFWIGSNSGQMSKPENKFALCTLILIKFLIAHFWFFDKKKSIVWPLTAHESSEPLCSPLAQDLSKYGFPFGSFPSPNSIRSCWSLFRWKEKYVAIVMWIHFRLLRPFKFTWAVLRSRKLREERLYVNFIHSLHLCPPNTHKISSSPFPRSHTLRYTLESGCVRSMQFFNSLYASSMQSVAADRRFRFVCGYWK